MKSMGMFIIREWKKTLLLFTLFFVSFSLITTTFLLEAASERTIEKIKPEASGVITIKTDIIDYPERLFSDEEVNGEYYKEYNILLSKLKELQSDDRINYIDFNIYKYMYAGTLNGNLSPIIVYNKDDDVIYQSDYENGYNKLSFIMNSIESGDFNDIITEHNNEEIAKKWIIENNNRVIVYGDYDPSLLERRNNNIAISKGRTFSDEEMINGDFVCILEKSSFYEYPDKNINTNDVVSIIDYYVKDEKIVYSKVYQFTVVGIYEVKNKNGFSGTRMYVPIKTIEKIQNNQQFYMNKYDCNTFTDEWLKEDVFVPLVDVNDIDDVYANSLAIIMHQSKQSFLSQPRIEIKNIEDVEIVASEIENDCKDCSNLRVITSTVEYDKIVRPITDLKNSSQLMMVIVIIVSVGILSATVFMVMRDRKVEAGIYMSLGERMHTIVFRRILEVFLISSIAIIMSLKCGNVLGKSIIKDYRIDNINYEDDNQLVRQDYNEINREMVIKLDCLSITKIIIICYGISMASTCCRNNYVKKDRSQKSADEGINMDQVKIGKLITKLRKDKNMTQEELAEKLSVSNRSVSRWETGKNMPDMSLLIPISEILGITVTELLSGEIKEDVTLTAEQAVVDTINYSQKKISNISLKLKWMTIITVLVIFIISTVFIVQYIEEQSRISIFKSFTNETTKEEVIEKAGMPDNYSDINSSSKDSYFEYDISNNVKVTVYYVLIDGNESVNSIKIKRKTKDEWIMSPLKGKYRLNIGGYNDYNYIIFDNGYYRIEGNNEELDILFEKREGKCSFVLNNMSSDSPDGIYFYLDDEKYIKGEDYPLINVRGNGYKSIIVRKNKEIRIKDEP